MIYYYDGSFDGLMTVIFEKYNDIGKCEISKENDQANFLESEYLKTNLVQAQRVITTIKDNIGDEFFADAYKVFKSQDDKKEEVIAVTIKSCLIYGRLYLGCSKRAAIKFRQIVKSFNHELHAYKGLARFREIQDDYLLAEIQAENDILEHLTPHFLARMPNEKFLIYDKNRKKASLCINGKWEIVEILEMNGIDSKQEEIFKDAWRGFYDAIGIKERKNHKLMVSNMPKKYWKYLPEKNDSYK